MTERNIYLPEATNVDVTVSVPVKHMIRSHEDMERKGILYRDLVDDAGWLEEDLRVALATLTTVMDSVPMLTSNFVELLLDTGCRNTVRDVVERHYKIEKLEAA